MTKNAIFSVDKLHRYMLSRIWDRDLPCAMCIGLNPSTADAEKDDSTITYLLRCFRKLGYGGLYMVNLHSFIASDPTKLVISNLASNDWWIKDSSMGCEAIIFCWGDFPQAGDRAGDMKTMFEHREILCFGKSKKGNPYHPQRLARSGIQPDDVTLKVYWHGKLKIV